MSDGLPPISPLDWVSPHWQNWQPWGADPTSPYDIQSPVKEEDPGDLENIPLYRVPYVETPNLPPGVLPGTYHGFPDGPPPGLVRVMPPVPVHDYDRHMVRAPRILTEDDIPMFGEMARYLGGYDPLDGGRIILDLTCRICNYRNLDVPAIVAPRLDAEFCQEAEPFTVLPCGHFFGSGCLQVWLRTSEDEALNDQRPYRPSCPYCRCPLTYEGCGHPLKLRPYDPRFPRAGQTPATFPEGGIIADECTTCAGRRLEAAAGEVVQRIYPPRIPHEAFVDPDECSPNSFEILRDRIWDDIFACYYWAQQKFSFW
ncbi:hypothetical protein GGR53DRAFT_527821 [Hypoxylon sp. FL1150]|nr:hypothetical protein GGR53DRAFT_527821 [Hypoxylon sp. FL1150]